MLNLRKIFEKKAIVLMYHRVASVEVDPWELAVDPENFEKQLNVLKQYNVVSLDELTRRVKQKKIKEKCIAVTFDDGYEDNYSIAKPLMEKYQVPATFFITSKNIGKEKEFWWDELAHIILETKKLPETFHLNWENIAMDFELGGEAELTDELQRLHRKFSIYHSLPTLRSQLYFNIWEKLFPMHETEQDVFMNMIRSWANVTESKRSEFSCMSTLQISELASKSLFTVGGHTTTHPALSFHDKCIQYKEIIGNKLFLENLAGDPVQFFAFPSGKFNKYTVEAVREAGFEASVTTDHRPVKKDADPFLLGRFQVNNWETETFKRRLDHWFRL